LGRRGKGERELPGLDHDVIHPAPGIKAIERG
jgi:hypothetical protein